MSLSTLTPEPRRRAAVHEVPAAFRKAPPRLASTPKSAASRDAAASGHHVDATRLFRRFEQLLPEGEHIFSDLRQEFNKWCREGDVTPPAPNKLSTWLTQAGLVSSRRGRQKVTVFVKARRALAA